MKKLDKKDMPKLIALVVLSLGVFVFALMQAMPKTSAGSKPAGSQGSATATGTAATAPVENPATVPVETPGEYNVADIEILTGGKDPFVPNGPAAPVVPGQVSTPQPADKPAPVAKSEPSGPTSDTPPVSGRQSAQFARPPVNEPQQPVAVAPVVVPLLPPPAFVVTGVVRGEQEDIVILRGGGNGSGSGDAVERRFVRVGDSVGNGFVVSAIFRDGVEIRSGNRRVTLKLGGDSRAK